MICLKIVGSFFINTKLCWGMLKKNKCTVRKIIKSCNLRYNQILDKKMVMMKYVGKLYEVLEILQGLISFRENLQYRLKIVGKNLNILTCYSRLQIL